MNPTKAALGGLIAGVVVGLIGDRITLTVIRISRDDVRLGG